MNSIKKCKVDYPRAFLTATVEQVLPGGRLVIQIGEYARAFSEGDRVQLTDLGDSEVVHGAAVRIGIDCYAGQLPPNLVWRSHPGDSMEVEYIAVQKAVGQ